MGEEKQANLMVANVNHEKGELEIGEEKKPVEPKKEMAESKNTKAVTKNSGKNKKKDSDSVVKKNLKKKKKIKHLSKEDFYKLQIFDADKRMGDISAQNISLKMKNFALEAEKIALTINALKSELVNVRNKIRQTNEFKAECIRELRKKYGYTKTKDFSYHPDTLEINPEE